MITTLPGLYLITVGCYAPITWLFGAPMDFFNFSNLSIFNLYFSKNINLFLQWDPMITTLPGLYLITVGTYAPVTWLFGAPMELACTTFWLRFINLVLAVGNVIIIKLLMDKIHQRDRVSILRYTTHKNPLPVNFRVCDGKLHSYD